MLETEWENSGRINRFAILVSLGTEVVGNTPAEAEAIIKAEIDRIRKLINDAGLKEQ